MLFIPIVTMPFSGLCPFDSNELNQEITDRLIDVVYRLLCDDELQLAVLLRQKLIQKVRPFPSPPYTKIDSTLLCCSGRLYMN